jgi:hypothetical protein
VQHGGAATSSLLPGFCAPPVGRGPDQKMHVMPLTMDEQRSSRKEAGEGLLRSFWWAPTDTQHLVRMRQELVQSAPLSRSRRDHALLILEDNVHADEPLAEHVHLIWPKQHRAKSPSRRALGGDPSRRHRSISQSI